MKTGAVLGGPDSPGLAVFVGCIGPGESKNPHVAVDEKWASNGSRITAKANQGGCFLCGLWA